MGSLLAEVIPLGVGAMISPVLLVIQVLTLTGKTKPVRRAAALTAGAAVTLAVVTLLLFTIATGVDIGTNRHADPASVIVKGICAVVLLGLGIRSLIHRRHARRRDMKRLASAKTRAFLAAGLLGMLTNVTSLVLYIPAMHITYEAQVSLADKATAVLIVYLFTMAPLLVPLVIALALGPKAGAILGAMNRFVTKHSADINAGLCFVFATYLGYGAVSAI